MAVYTVTYVREDGMLASRQFNGAPAPYQLGYPRARFAMRYFPSKKEWRVYDLHQVTVFRHGSVPATVYRTRSEEAGLMWMQLMRTKT